jgi:hypothetical protein
MQEGNIQLCVSRNSRSENLAIKKEETTEAIRWENIITEEHKAPYLPALQSVPIRERSPSARAKFQQNHITKLAPVCKRFAGKSLAS